MTRKEIAMNYFEEGYNCAQSVTLAFEDLLCVKREELLALTSSFGGGMGRLREVCGAVTGMFVVAGLLYGYTSPDAKEEKASHYERIQNLAAEFSAKRNSIICRELLGIEKKQESFVPEERTSEYYKERPCKELVGTAAEILDDYILRYK